jgi:uncharacterized protein YebE (UPF0316 family)
MIELFIIKLLDCALGTTKNIFLYKNKNFLSALSNTVSAMLFFFLVSSIAKNNGILALAMISIATLIGSYVPTLIMKKLEKDRVFIFDITPDTHEKGKEFADYIRDNNLPLLTYKGYNQKREQVLCCKIFSPNKEMSKLIEKSIPLTFKFNVVETKNYAV